MRFKVEFCFQCGRIGHFKPISKNTNRAKNHMDICEQSTLKEGEIVISDACIQDGLGQQCNDKKRRGIDQWSVVRRNNNG